MSLVKAQTVDRIEVAADGSVQVRTLNAIVEDGKQISGSFHRHIIAPGDDYSGEDDRVKAICKATHTSGVVAAYQTKLAEQQIPAA